MSRYRWVILVVGVGAQGAAAAALIGMPALAPTVRATYDLSLTATALAIASVSIGVLVMLLPWGLLADRVGERIVIATGLAGATAALCAAAAAPSFGWLVAALVVTGMFTSSANAASGRAVVGWFERRQRGFALGIRQMALPLGGAVAAAALPLITRAGGLDAALFALAGGCAAGSALAFVFLREPGAPTEDASGPAALASDRSPLRDPRIRRLAFASGFLSYAQLSLLSLAVLYLHDARGFSPAAAAAWLALLQVGGAAARVGAGALSDRRGARLGPMRAIAVAAALAFAALTALDAAPDAFAVPALVVAGVLSMSWNGLSFAAVAEMAGFARSGAALGTQNSVLAFAAATAPLVTGAFVAATSWPVAFAAMAASAGAGVLLLSPLVALERRGPARPAAARPLPASPPSGSL